MVPGVQGDTKAGEEAEEGLAAELVAEDPAAVVDPSNAFPLKSREAPGGSFAGTGCTCMGPFNTDRGDVVGEHTQLLVYLADPGGITKLPSGVSADVLGQPNLMFSWDGLSQQSWLGEVISLSRATNLVGPDESTSNCSGFPRMAAVSSPPKPCSLSHVCREEEKSMDLRCFKTAEGLEVSASHSKPAIKCGNAVLV